MTADITEELVTQVVEDSDAPTGEAIVRPSGAPGEGEVVEEPCSAQEIGADSESVGVLLEKRQPLQASVTDAAH